MDALDLSRPDIVFALVWVVTALLARADLYYMGFYSSVAVTSLIAANVLSFVVVYRVVRLTRSALTRRHIDLTEAQLSTLCRINSLLFLMWLAMFVFIVFRSHGIPIWWRIAHIKKSYVDFGVPTLSGFANMMRSIILCLSILMWLRRRDRTAVAIIVALLICSVAEMARANTIYLLLCGLAVLFVRKRVGAKTLGLLTVIAVVCVLLFGVAERYRTPGGSGGEKYLTYPSVLNKLPYGFTDVYLYLSTPISNLYYAEVHGVKPRHYPYYSLELMLPTIVRERVYRAHDYPIALRVESFNATTFYSPFIADFGLVIAGLLVGAIEVMVSYVHIRAHSGDMFYQLAYAPLYAALALSFFYNYFLTLGVVLFLFMVVLLRAALIDRKLRHGAVVLEL